MKAGPLAFTPPGGEMSEAFPVALQTIMGEQLVQ